MMEVLLWTLIILGCLSSVFILTFGHLAIGSYQTFEWNDAFLFLFGIACFILIWTQLLGDTPFAPLYFITFVINICIQASRLLRTEWRMSAFSIFYFVVSGIFWQVVAIYYMFEKY